MKILGSDYDGTLNRNGIDEKTRAAIAAFRASGNKFGIVTGRGHPSILFELERNDFYEYDFLVCNTGSAVYSEDKLISSSYADGAVLPDLYEFIKEMGGRHMAIGLDEQHHFVIFGRQSDKKEGREDNEVYITPENLSTFGKFNQVDTSFDAQDEYAAEFARQVNERFNGKLSASSNGFCVDIVASGVSKESGIYKYIAEVGGVKEKTLTLGDNFNDISMLREFGGYVMDTGKKQVIEKIGRTCTDISSLIKEWHV